MRTLFKWVAMSYLFIVVNSAAAYVTVGADQGCDYNDIESAYNGNDNVIRIANDQTYTDDFLITKQVFFFGGYDSCLDAQNNQLGSDNSVWDGADSQTVVNINTNNGFQSIISLDRFTIQNGAGDVGGIGVKGRTTLLLSNSVVYNNVGIGGGGLLVSGSTAKAVISDSMVTYNDADNGAGIYCESDAEVTMNGQSRLAYNLSETGNGGGIYATSGCSIHSTSGSDFPGPANGQYGIIGNYAQAGGGVYITDGASMVLAGNVDYPANIISNVSISSIQGGGGVYVEGANSTFLSINGHIDNNSAPLFGSGFYVTNQARFDMYRLNANCWNNNRCSSLSGNFTRFDDGYAAAGFAQNGGIVNISQSTIAGNLADNHVLFTIKRSAYLRLEGNLIFDNKNYHVTIPQSLINISGEPANGGNVDFFYNTLTKNISQAVFFLEDDAQHRLNINNSIIFNLGVVLEQQGVTNNIIQADCSVLHETDTITGNVGFLSTADPQFVDEGNNDFTLSDDSVAVDLCDEALFTGANFPDVNGLPRGYDLITQGNLFGPYDAGAHELDGDLIFKSGFE